MLLFWWRHGGPPPAPAAERPLAKPPVIAPMPNAGERPAPTIAPTAPRVRRIAPAERQALIDAIARARDRRTGRATTGTTASGLPPTLPDVTITPAEIQTSVREILPLLAECFEEARPRMAVNATTVTARLVVSGEPEVGALIDSVELAADDHGLDDPGFRECLQETMMAVAFPPMPEGGQLEIHYPFVFRDDP